MGTPRLLTEFDQEGRMHVRGLRAVRLSWNATLKEFAQDSARCHEARPQGYSAAHIGAVERGAPASEVFWETMSFMLSYPQHFLRGYTVVQLQLSGRVELREAS